MRKFIVLSLAGCLMSAFGATAYGQAKLDFKASGPIDIITTLNRNVPYNPQENTGNMLMNQLGARNTSTGATSHLMPNGVAFDQTRNYTMSRGRLKFDAAMGKEVVGTIFFEIDSNEWGEISGTGDQRNQA